MNLLPFALSPVLLLLLLTGCGEPETPVTPTPPPTSSAVVSPAPSESVPPSPLPDTINPALDAPFSGDGEGSWTGYFDVPEEEPSFHVRVENTGETPLTVHITSETLTGTLQAELTVPVGGTETAQVLNTDSGRRYVSIIGTAGNPFSGHILIRTASDPALFDE